MTDWRTSPFRAGAIPFELANEADVVFCFDEAHRKAISKTSVGKLGVDVFQESPKTLTSLARKKQLAVFNVVRDGYFQGFVAVGKPPSSVELSSGKWKQPQSLTLTIPSGRLRVETALSFSLGPDFADHDGLSIEIPPGEYLLTMLEREDDDIEPGIAYRDQPRILITLTPAEGTAIPREKQGLRCSAAPPPRPPGAKYADDWTINDNVFSGLLSPDGSTVNLNPVAAQQLGIRVGDVIEIQSNEHAIESFFMGDASWAADWLFPCPVDITDATRTCWSVYEELGKTPVLSIQSWSKNASRLPPAKKASLWRPARVTRTSRPNLTGTTEFAPCAVEGTTIRARVLICRPTVIVLNADRQSLDAIGCRPDWTTKVTMNLKCGTENRRLTITKERGNWGARRFNFYCEMGDNRLNSYLTLKQRAKLTSDSPEQFIAAVGVEMIATLKLQPLLDDLKAYGPEQALKIGEFPRPLELLGALNCHWSSPDREILCLETLSYTREQNWHSITDKRPTNHELELEVGDEVILAVSDAMNSSIQ